MTNRRAIRILFISIVVFAFFAVKNSLRSRAHLREHQCTDQLLAIEGAKEQFAIEHEGVAPDKMDDLIPKYLDRVLQCPSGGNYVLGDLQTPATCSFEHHKLPTE